jgi:DNA-binding CsgD family transcriptional regulator
VGRRIRVVGRDAELASLRRSVDALPVGGLVIVEGEAGVGKTTLLDVVAARADSAGVDVLRTGADEFTAARPVGLLAGELGAPASSTDIDDLLTMLDRRSAGRGVTVVLDDLQWADDASLALLAPFVRRAVPMGALVVLAMRSWPRVPALDEMLDRLIPLQPTWIRLAPLSTDELSALGEVQLGRPVGPGIRDLLAGTGGNPFYALSLLRILTDEGVIDHDDPVADVDPGSIELDRSALGSLVTRRVAALGPDVERLLQQAATLGRSFGVSELAALSGQSDDVTMVWLGVAVAADVLRRDGDRIVFRHDLVRGALENALMPAVRMAIHRRAADLALERGDNVIAAAHFLRAELDAGDVDVLASLVSDCSPSVGLALLDRALALVGSDDPRYRVLATERVDFLLWTGDADGAVRAARDLLSTRVDDDTAAALRTTIAHALFVLGRAAEAVDSWVRFPEGTDDVLRAGELGEMAFATLFAGRLLPAAELARESLSLTDEATAVTISSLVLGWVAAAAGDAEVAREYVDTAVRHAPGANETARRMGPHLISAMVRDLGGDRDGALAEIRLDQDEALDRASIIRVPFRHMTTAIVHLRAGDFDDALAEADAGIVSGVDFDVRGLDGWLRTIPAIIALHRNGPEAASAMLGAAELQLGSDWWFWTRGVVDAAAGELEGSLGLFELVATVGAGVGSTSSVALVAPDAARAAIVLGTPDRAMALVALAPPDSVNAAPLTARLDWARALLSHDLDALARVSVDLAVARPFEAAQALHDLAIAAAPSDPDRARDAAKAAFVGYERSRADWSAARLRADLREHGIRFRATGGRRERIGWGAVTATERMVIDLVVAGHTNAEIAGRLVMSRRTVESHLVHVYDKVGIRSRAELISTAPSQLAPA